MTPITPQLVRAALAFVPPNLSRDEWARIGMAVKSELPDDEGKDAFMAWSASADNYREADALSTWRSLRADGGVGIGTLLHYAKVNGFDLKAHTGPQLAPEEASAETARATALRARRREEEQAAQAKRHAAAALAAVALWDEGGDAARAPYLVRKGVRAYDVRSLPQGTLLVPVRDAEGELWNVQQIAPERPASGPDKLFLRGGRKSGLWHWCGQPADAPVLLVAEGYASAASVHEATGWPVAVAFDAGNLLAVARAIAQSYPAALIVIAGDDDCATAARSGTNTGRIKAVAAATAVRGLAVFPAPLPEGGAANFDFNDLHAAAGVEAVRDLVRDAIEAELQRRADEQRADTSNADQEGAWDGPFRLREDGVWFEGVDREGRPTVPEWICSHLAVVARTRDQEGGSWGYLLQFADPLSVPKQWAMPARMLAGDGGEYRATLLHMGLRIAPSPRARNKLTEYIQTRTPNEYATCTDRIGWHGTAFVLPHRTIGGNGERIVFQSESQMENTFRVKGTAERWRDKVGALCAGNTRMVFAISCAFAGPMMRPGGIESGGFHLRGDSSSGKTTALKLAASVYGGANYLQRWRVTSNALESIAAQHCDALLTLDELAQVEPKEAGESAYLLANEQSKARATRNGAARPRLSWRVLFLSAGELSLADHMAEGNKRARTGQEVRMVDIPADAGKGLGAFDTIHDFAGAAAYATYLARESLACHGAPGLAFLEWATEHAEKLPGRIRTRTAELARQWTPEGAAGQVDRVCARFALVAMAGELATEVGLTGWQPGEAERAARACFDAWMAARGGAGNGEVAAMLRAVRRFLESHGESRFTWWHRAADDHNAKTLQRAGFRRMLNDQGEPIRTNSQHGSEFGNTMPASVGEGVSVEYFILPEVFRAEVCQGFDHHAVCRVLLAHECLLPGAGRPYDSRHRFPGLGLANAYRIPPAIMGLEL